MAGSTRIRGNKLGITFGTGPAAENRWCDTTAATLEHEDADSDVLTFCDAAEGGKSQPFLNLTITQSLQKSSFWRYLWENAGQVVPFTYAPQGNETPTDDEPHFVGFCQIPANKPTVGGEAAIGGGGYTSELRLDVTDADGGKPGGVTLDTGTPV